jgi:hypothetical protein
MLFLFTLLARRRHIKYLWLFHWDSSFSIMRGNPTANYTNFNCTLRDLEHDHWVRPRVQQAHCMLELASELDLLARLNFLSLKLSDHDRFQLFGINSNSGPLFNTLQIISSSLILKAELAKLSAAGRTNTVGR